jgi:hypothetical protein
VLALLLCTSRKSNIQSLHLPSMWSNICRETQFVNWSQVAVQCYTGNKFYDGEELRLCSLHCPVKGSNIKRTLLTVKPEDLCIARLIKIIWRLHSMTALDPGKTCSMPLLLEVADQLDEYIFLIRSTLVVCIFSHHSSSIVHVHKGWFASSLRET